MNTQRGTGTYAENSDTPQGRKHIFGICINDYAHWRSLNNAVKDLDDIVSILVEDYDFDRNAVVLLKNDEATRKNIVNKLYHYTNDPSVLGEHDSLLIYFSGHGFLDSNDDGYWVPYESAQNDIDSFVPNDTIHRHIKHLKCRHVLLISDSCFSGSLVQNGRDIETNMLTAQELERKKSRWLITSGGRAETVADGSGRNSPFAEAIISELRHNQKPKLIADELALRVRSITRGNAVQMPQIEKIFGAGDLGGRFVFNKKKSIKETVIVEEVKETTPIVVVEKQDDTPRIVAAATVLIAQFMDILKTNSFEMAAQKVLPLVHRSLTANGQLKPDFKKNNVQIACERAVLYPSRVDILSIKPTGRTSIGILSVKEEGAEWLFSIAKTEEKGGLSAYIRVFFPKNNADPTLTSVSL